MDSKKEVVAPIVGLAPFGTEDDVNTKQALKALLDKFCAASKGRYTCVYNDKQSAIFITDTANQFRYQMSNTAHGFVASYHSEFPKGDSPEDRLAREKLAQGLSEIIQNVIKNSGDIVVKAKISAGDILHRYEIAKYLVEQGIYVEPFYYTQSETEKLRTWLSVNQSRQVELKSFEEKNKQLLKKYKAHQSVRDEGSKATSTC